LKDRFSTSDNIQQLSRCSLLAHLARGARQVVEVILDVLVGRLQPHPALTRQRLHRSEHDYEGKAETEFRVYACVRQR
jgi:hypothetical protein